MKRAALILFHAAAVISVLLAICLVVVFLCVDFSGDAPEEWKWMRPNGGVRTFLLAKEKIEWTTTTPISRGKVNTYAQLASLGYPRVHRNGWVFK